MNYQTVLHFWFEELGSSDWFAKNTELDKIIKGRFKKVHDQAKQGELYQWRKWPRGRLAEIIVLDQFSRNIYRDTPEAFACDAQALCLSQETIASGLHRNFNTSEKLFLYLPFMHSESKMIHNLAMELFKAPGLEWNLEFEIKHKNIIDQFGRYPHRNLILGRSSTAEEIQFLKTPGSSF